MKNAYILWVKDILVPILYMRDETKAYDNMANSWQSRDLTQVSNCRSYGLTIMPDLGKFYERENNEIVTLF